MTKTVSDNDVSSVIAWADRVESRFRVLIEFGLFDDNSHGATVLTAVKDARRLARAAKVDRAAAKLGHAELAIQKALYAKSWIWRSWYIHQGGIFIYHFVVMLVLLNIASGYIRIVAQFLWPQIPVPMAALAAGGLGASLRGMWYLWLQVSKGIFRAQFTIAHLAAPWIGMMFGLFTFLLLKAGLLAIKGGEAAQLESSALPLALAFLAGYSWEWILGRIDQIRAATSGSAAASQGVSAREKPTASSALTQKGAVTDVGSGTPKGSTLSKTNPTR
jgi:hypothetical protein